MKQGEYSTARPDARATEVKQLNTGGLDQRQNIKPQLKVPIESFTPEPSLSRRAIKEGSKVVNRDWVNPQACSLSHNILL